MLKVMIDCVGANRLMGGLEELCGQRCALYGPVYKTAGGRFALNPIFF